MKRHNAEPVPITEDTARLLHAHRTGELRQEGGSDTAEALAVASVDRAVCTQPGLDADSYMAGYLAAVYEQAEPILYLLEAP